jgi:quinol monooxygenase YgiN
MHKLLLTTIIALLACTAAFTGRWALAQPAGTPPAQRAPEFHRFGQTIVEALQASPGCLGVETAQTASGKNVIFAWFEDKQAALAWHNSDAHQRMMDRFFPERPQERTPMEHIADDAGPILTIASLKPAEQLLPGTRMPVSEIAIEMYAPLPGGIRINGGFTPAAIPVPHRVETTIDPGEPRGGADQPRRPEGGAR